MAIFRRRRPSLESGKGLILKRDVQDSQRWSWPSLGRSEMAVKVIGSWAPEPTKQRIIIFFFVAGGLGRGFGRRHCFDRGRGPEGCSVFALGIVDGLRHVLFLLRWRLSSTCLPLRPLILPLSFLRGWVSIYREE